jgi:uncharacterized protein
VGERCADVQEELRRNYADLKNSIRSMGRGAVTFSGGVDSTLLLKVSIDELGCGNVLALTGVSPIHARSESDGAKECAAALGAHVIFFESTEMEDESFVANGRDRCYHCKACLFKVVREIARREGYSFLLEGSNADDEKDFRPGRRACLEFNVVSPLLDGGFTKNDIRELSRALGLATCDKPSEACLYSRIPYGTAITRKMLEDIERSEAFVRSLGVSRVRVRHHGSTARIETDEKDFPVILEYRDEIAAELMRTGFTYIALDLHGYRTGSMNEEE